jgi:DNA excision repair protein ERCC-2
VTYTISVRGLCEFTAKRGDLDRRFTPAPSAQEGMEGHAMIAGRRRTGYEREIALEGEHGELLVRGRADGYDPTTNQLEEFKTYRGSLERMPENHRALHWAQLRVYGALLCRKRSLPEIQLALVYFDIGTEQETTLVEHYSAQALEQEFLDHCERFIGWARSETAHRSARDTALQAQRFPFPDFHAGQRDLAEATYKIMRRGGALLAQAPTGIGKTLGTIFPTLKAMPTAGLDRLFYLSAKTPGRQLALDALAHIERSSPDTGSEKPLRVLELVARDKACENPDKECAGDSCPLARGFYDRLAAARSAAVQKGMLDHQSLREIARAHQVCPYYLGQELMRWSDVVVGDYNYYFDITAPLYTLTNTNQWKVCLLVDEAHNLIERARKMYSASLDRAALETVQFGAPLLLKNPLNRVARAWDEVLGGQTEPYRAYEEVPEVLLGSLARSITATTDFIVEQPGLLAAEVETFYFEAMNFCDLAAQLDNDTLFDVTREPSPAGHSTLCVRNVIPRRFLTPRWNSAHAVVLFSATLSPPEFHLDMLGLPPDSRRIDVKSPFKAEQLAVRIVRSISTRWRHRAASVQPIGRLMASQFQAQPGNYLAFFSSFDYLHQVACDFVARNPDVPVWRQERGMKESERTDFLQRFTPDGQGIGFAVLGGAFGEGIDLPGTRLIGAFIATLGLPQVSPVNDEMQRRMESRFNGAGYAYTYLYPGLQKVVQAAGRVIRTTEDRGAVYLMDERFAQREVRGLLPKWWTISPTSLPTGVDQHRPAAAADART